MHFHWQNLNEDERGRPRGFPWSGRAWLRFSERPDHTTRRGAAHVEWNLRGRHAGASIQVDPNDCGVTLFFGLPPFNVWLGVEELWYAALRDLWQRVGSAPRRIGVAFHDGAAWWSLWENEHCWSRRDPWWMRATIRPADLLGKQRYEERLLEERDVIIPMLERKYPARAKLFEQSRWRERLPFKRRNLSVRIDLAKNPIPYSGKGENPWDCGEDGLWGISLPADSIEKAIGLTVAAVLETRAQRGDPAEWPATTTEAA